MGSYLPAYAKHLVEEAFAASYLTAPAASAEPPAKRSKKQTETDK